MRLSWLTGRKATAVLALALVIVGALFLVTSLQMPHTQLDDLDRESAARAGSTRPHARDTSAGRGIRGGDRQSSSSSSSSSTTASTSGVMSGRSAAVLAELHGMTDLPSNLIPGCSVHNAIASGGLFKPMSPTLGPFERIPADQQLQDPDGHPVDFVISVSHIHCAVWQAAEAINWFYRPRFIWYLSSRKEDCPLLESFAPNVRCVWESEVIPNWSMDAMRRTWTNDEKRARSGWYYYQMLNLGSSRHIGCLSPYYVVWDSDCIPISRQEFFKDGKVVYYTQQSHGNDPAVVDRALGYHVAFNRLTGLPMLHPGSQFSVANPTPMEDTSSETWVTHFMVMKRSYMNEMLSYIEQHRGVPRHRWMYEIIKVVEEPDHVHRRDGFADYDSYGSFVKHFHPESQLVMEGSWKHYDSVTWSSNHIGFGPCCLHPDDRAQMQARGAHYTMYEVHKRDARCTNTYMAALPFSMFGRTEE